LGKKTERRRKHRERGSNDNDDYERLRTTTNDDASFVVEVLDHNQRPDPGAVRS
jgi:hypothetical protein